jgi:hypothetical protein
VGCSALADHLRAATWPSKFRLHLPEKYDGTSNPSEFLQVCHCHYDSEWRNCRNGNVFSCCLVRACPDLAHEPYPRINLFLGRALRRFIVNFASAYQQHGVEAHLHAVRQEPGETLRTFISRFTKVRCTIPRISDASIITAFRQGVRDEKMLEKLATHDVETITTLFALADKCDRTAEGRAWHSTPHTGVAQIGGWLGCRPPGR